MHRLLLVFFACRAAPPPVPTPPPPADGRTLVTADCTTVPRQSAVIAMHDMTEHRLTPDATLAFVMRGRQLFLEVTGEQARPLAIGAMDDLDFKAYEPSEDGTFNSAMLPQGGPSNEQYRLRVDGCTVELLQTSRDDIGTPSEEAVVARYVVAPKTRVWAR
jgi:hypothetical protein